MIRWVLQRSWASRMCSHASDLFNPQSDLGSPDGPGYSRLLYSWVRLSLGEVTRTVWIR